MRQSRTSGSARGRGAILVPTATQAWVSFSMEGSTGFLDTISPLVHDDSRSSGIPAARHFHVSILKTNKQTRQECAERALVFASNPGFRDMIGAYPARGRDIGPMTGSRFVSTLLQCGPHKTAAR